MFQQCDTPTKFHESLDKWWDDKTIVRLINDGTPQLQLIVDMLTQSIILSNAFKDIQLYYSYILVPFKNNFLEEVKTFGL